MRFNEYICTMKNERIQITVSVNVLRQLKIIAKKRDYNSERDFIKEMIRVTISEETRTERYGLSDNEYSQLVATAKKQNNKIKDCVKSAIHFYLEKVIHLPYFL